MRSRHEEFVPPPEAPVFEPTEEEFKDPLGYINKIRPVAERTGICKIRPPTDWTPPFSVDVSNFRFTPRIQRLNELEATTRVKFNFMDAVAKFWELQGTAAKHPNVEGAPLDLHALWKAVNEEGGFEHVALLKKWPEIAHKMGYSKWQQTSVLLRNHYEKILYPYLVFRAVQMSEMSTKTESRKKLDERPSQTHAFPTSAMSTHSVPGARQGKKRMAGMEDANDSRSQRELKKLEFAAPGPHHLADGVVKAERDNESSSTSQRSRSSSPGSVSDSHTYPRRAQKRAASAVVCHSCEKSTDRDSILTCDECNLSYHTFCLITPLSSVPSLWRCPSCVAAECQKTKDPYGFEQAKKNYTLESFGEMANQFKSEYFDKRPHEVPTELVEKEFWRLVHSLEDDVVVEYGADLHSAEHGSGFPCQDSCAEDDLLYAESEWNLNNMPNLEKSVLRHITADISGMKVPWLYVGMCFSSFCWHNEDHWSYSINYLHWGEPKTWYGLPGGCAEKFENVMKDTAPELFDDSPDLLHHLVTLISPNVLMKHRIPVVRTNQHAGEFVVTFPRAYHAGFNQGYNFAEAVNFSTADWIPFGRKCMDHYRQLHRYTVFSHDELICKMAMRPAELDLSLAGTVHQDMMVMVEREKRLRRILDEKGVSNSEREAFELLPDDERQCARCQVICFLSALTCPCSQGRLVCLYHLDELCDCAAANKCLRYRYNLNELAAMLQKVQMRAESYATWARQVEGLLDAEGAHRPTIQDLKSLINQAEEGNFSAPDLIEEMEVAINEAEQFAVLATQLVSKKRQARNDADNLITLEELQEFMVQVDNLACRIEEADLIVELLRKVQEYQLSMEAAVADPAPSLARLTELLEQAQSLDVDVPQLAGIEQKMQQARWLDEAQKVLTAKQGSGVSLEKVQDLLQSSKQHTPHPVVDNVVHQLREIVKISDKWEAKAKTIMDEKPTVAYLQSVLSEVQSLPIDLPVLTSLCQALENATQWGKEATNIQDSDVSPDLETLEELLSRARPIPVQLEQLAQIESLVAAAQGWRDRACRAFLKKSISSSCTLLQVLYPRLDLAKRLDTEPRTPLPNLTSYLPRMDSDKEARLLQQLARDEVFCMRQLRQVNMARSVGDVAGGSAAANSKYCVCRRPPAGTMLLCELCLDWFHSSCVHLPRTKSTSSSSPSIKEDRMPPLTPSSLQENKFLCPLCVRSRRPRLDTVLSLLVSLRKVPVQLVECAALQSLTERAMHWQEQARQSLAEAAALLEQQNPVAASAVLNSPLISGLHGSPSFYAGDRPPAVATGGGAAAAFIARSQPLPPGLVAAATQAAPCKSQLRSTAPLGRPSSSSTQNNLNPVIKIPQPPPTLANARHISSVCVESTVGLSTLRGMTEEEINTPTSGDGLTLPANVRGHLEELMLQGDLFEVYMDETQQLWQLLQLHVNKESVTTIDAPLQDDLSKEDRKKKKKRPKREDEENDPAPPPAEPAPTISIGSPPPEKKRKKKPEKRTAEPEKSPPAAPVEGHSPPANPKEPHTLAAPASEMPRHFQDEECSAGICSRPVGEAVEWVQCDTCQRWFHLSCVGLQPAEVQAMDSYACIRCRSSSHTGGFSSLSVDAVSLEDSTAASMLLAVAQSGLPSSLGKCFAEDSDPMVVHVIDKPRAPVTMVTDLPIGSASNVAMLTQPAGTSDAGRPLYLDNKSDETEPAAMLGSGTEQADRHHHLFPVCAATNNGGLPAVEEPARVLSKDDNLLFPHIALESSGVSEL